MEIMCDNDKVYVEKRVFVDKLNAALTMTQEIESVEYRNISDKYSEYIRVRYEGGISKYIDVTGNSLKAIAEEISRVLLRIKTDAEIKNEMHLAIIEGWFEAAR